MTTDVVGSIRPALDAQTTEVPSWGEPYKAIVVTDQNGRRHGRIEWLASEMGDEFTIALHELFLAATRSEHRPSVPSAAS
jgi:hypothetical protein